MYNKIRESVISLIFMGLLLSHNKIVFASGGAAQPEWMNLSINGLAGLYSNCIERPTLDGIVQNNATVNLSDSGFWVSTGIAVNKDKLLRIEWDSRGVIPNPRKYLVLYRIDPRFEGPQIFIQTYDYSQGRYLSDFHSYLLGQLLQYQSRPEIDLPGRKRDFNSYFNFVNRDKIRVNEGDVVNISLENATTFFGGTNQFNVDYDPTTLLDPELIYTKVGINDNQILYVSAVNWCASLGAPAATLCVNNTYRNATYPLSNLLGVVNDANFSPGAFSACANNVTGLNNPICYYDKGRGMRIRVGGNTVKDTYAPFVTSNISGKHFLHYLSNSNGTLDFSSEFTTENMFNDVIQYMKDWNFASQTDLRGYLNTLPNPFTMNHLYVGRYVMQVEVGNGNYVMGPEDERGLKLFYYIQPTAGTPPSAADVGFEADRKLKTNAYESGFLWFRLVRPDNNLGGAITVKTGSYNGSAQFSTVVYNELVKPLRDKYNELTKIIYTKLITNATLQNIARTCLVLYIVIYALMFLAGATQVTAYDIAVRVIKIAIILTLFSPISWDFFSNNLFNVFINGADYLIASAVGVSSSVGNVFAFIDPIFDRYGNKDFWALLMIQLLQVQNGLIFFAIMTLYSMLIFFRAILEIIISYCLAFLGLAVLVSLAPFFITLILFERTRGMFDNWISYLFYYMMQPTILMVFFLLIDQLMGDQITNLVVRACWDNWIPLKVGLDLHHMGIPLSFSFHIPFLPYIPFWVSQVQEVDSAATLFSKEGTFLMVATSSLLFFAYCKMAAGLIEYVNLVTQSLTAVMAARIEGQRQGDGSATESIIGDMKTLATPVTGSAKAIGGFIKKKISDQDYSSALKKKGRGGGGGEIDYGDLDPSNQGSNISDTASDKISTGSGDSAPDL
jgi:type IV secretion system protein VirB6